MSENKHITLKKHQSHWLIGTIILFVLVGLACNLPVMASETSQELDPGFIETSVVQTMMAVVDGAASSSDGSDDDESAADDSAADQSGGDSEPAPPTATFTPSFTPTVTDTPTPSVVMANVEANTNCREGQGTVFKWLTSLEAGAKVEVFGIEDTGQYPYYYIHRPDQPSSFCWLWGKYVTLSGPVETLTKMTPMPSPTPGFEFKLTYINKAGPCGWGVYFTQYQVENIGAFTIESWKSKATDHDGGSDPQIVDADKFYKYDDSCNEIGTQTNLEPGEAHHVPVIFANDPSGHDITVTIRLCQEDANAGDCLTRTYRHTP